MPHHALSNGLATLQRLSGGTLCSQRDYRAYGELHSIVMPLMELRSVVSPDVCGRAEHGGHLAWASYFTAFCRAGPLMQPQHESSALLQGGLLQ